MSAAARPATRMWIPQDNPSVYKALVALQRASSAGVDPELAELIVIRASQLNGCAYCLHMHTSDALAKDIDPHKLMLIAAWREAGSAFTPAERAALALTESVTLIGENGVPDDVFDSASSRHCLRSSSRYRLGSRSVALRAIRAAPPMSVPPLPE